MPPECTAHGEFTIIYARRAIDIPVVPKLLNSRDTTVFE